MKIFNWIKKMFVSEKCQHNKRFTHRQWFDKDGTPMTYFHCWDCDFKDEGHVYGDPEQMRKDGWEKETHGKL